MYVPIFKFVFLFIGFTSVCESKTKGTEAVKTMFETIKHMEVHERPRRENAKFMFDKISTLRKEMAEKKEHKEPTFFITIDNINSNFLVKIMEAYVFLLGGLEEFENSLFKKQRIESEKLFKGSISKPEVEKSSIESMSKPETEKSSKESFSKPENEKPSKESVSTAETEKSSMDSTSKPETEKSESPYWDEFWKVVADAKNSGKRNSCCQTTLSPECCQKETQEDLIKKLAILMDTGSPGPSMGGNFQPEPEDYVDYEDEDQRGDRKLKGIEIEPTTAPPESTEAGTEESTKNFMLEV